VEDGVITDEALMSGVRAHDAEALATLYERHHRAAFALAYRILQDAGQAEDVVQEAFLAVKRRGCCPGGVSGGVASG
jgi:RNA polymerase sigma-70 factor (ECF subfamily)